MRSVGVFYMAVALFLGCSQHYEEGAHPSPKPPQPAPMPTGHPPVQNQASSGEAVVSGTIQLGVDIQSRLVKNAALFIIARPAPVGGPPLAVKRLDVPSFPYKYTLKQSDAMMAQGLDWSEIDALYLSAKIDADGSIGGSKTGDLEGVHVANPVQPGAVGVDIVIDTVH